MGKQVREAAPCKPWCLPPKWRFRRLTCGWFFAGCWSEWQQLQCRRGRPLRQILPQGLQIMHAPQAQPNVQLHGDAWMSCSAACVLLCAACRVSDLYHHRNELLEELKDADAAAAKGVQSG